MEGESSPGCEAPVVLSLRTLSPLLSLLLGEQRRCLWETEGRLTPTGNSGFDSRLGFVPRWLVILSRVIWPESRARHGGRGPKQQTYFSLFLYLHDTPLYHVQVEGGVTLSNAVIVGRGYYPLG